MTSTGTIPSSREVLQPLSPDSWWGAYAAQLEHAGIGAMSRRVIAEDSRYIVDRCVLGAGELGANDWGKSRQRSGLVMGAVQSGKTASMLAVTALALDRGVNCVIILAGTRRSLWLQTLERLGDQLDSRPKKLKRRVLLPIPGIATGSQSIPKPSDLYTLTRPGVTRMLSTGSPLVIVAMKNSAHLEQVGRLMRTVVAPEVLSQGQDFHTLVIDDEADDSSIDNVVQLPGADALTLEVKQVPRRILDLWEARQNPGATFNTNFYATYMAYTATPQANLLQDAENPLSPKHFVVGLRTPGETGSLTPRTATFKAPEGIRSWYTGGEMFYRALADVPLCMPHGDSDAELIDSIRAFFVGATVRWLRQSDKLSPVQALGKVWDSKESAESEAPAVSSMLVNPSASMGDHFDVAERILAWSRGPQRPHGGLNVDPDRGRELGISGVVADLNDNEEHWLKWLRNYQHSSSRLATMHPEADFRVPAVEEWEAVRRAMLEQVIPAIKVAVVNSDPNADDRPVFGPEYRDGSWHPPPNLSTIFVAGNVMSRGLTLEGLITTVFTRSAENPLADTQTQMQRWFGFRGSYLDLCRVFMRQEQIDLFSQYHENDELLRSEILSAMESGAVPDPIVLQGRRFVATGKIPSVRGVSLSPGTRPFFSLMNEPEDDEANRLIVSRLLREQLLIVGDGTHPRGVVLERHRSLVETADLLDELTFENHGADPSGFQQSRWRSAAVAAGIKEVDSVWPLYRAPERVLSLDVGHASPYSIAAYLRFWSACLNRAVPGLYTTDERPQPWRMLDQNALRLREIKFSIGVRFGPGKLVTEGALAALPIPVRPMERTVFDGSRIKGLWGSQNGPVDGDDFFDYEARAVEPEQTDDRTRPVGQNGLVLFHLIDRGAAPPTLALGCAIPRGGPDFVQATVGSSDE